MPTIKFDDYLNKRLENKEFKNSFDNEVNKLESAVALTKLREEQGLSQRELARLAHVPQSTIARIEKGSNTSVDTLIKIATALGKELKISFG